jgi:hypothetical protein
MPSLAGLFIYTSRGKCPFPTFQWSFSQDSHCYKLSRSKVVGVCCRSCLLCWLVYLKFREGLLLPPSSALRVPCPLCYMSFFVVVVYSVWVFFPLGGGQSVQGAMLIWPTVVCGSTTCCLAHLVVCFSRASRSWCLVAWEPSWFLHLMWSGDARHRLGVEVSVLPLLGGFSCKVFLQCLSKILL